MLRTSRLILSILTYAVLALVAAVGSLSVFVLSRNLDLLMNVVVFSNLSLTARASILVELYPGIGNAYSLETAVLLNATAVLVGIDIALVVYHVREHRVSVCEGSGSVTGVVLGTLGVGCASCGSVVLAGLLSLVGTGGALTLLPLAGLEFVLGALLILLLSNYWIAEGLKGGMIRGCPVDSTST